MPLVGARNSRRRPNGRGRATGKAITITGIVIYRIANGEIPEEWDYSDMLGLMRQLGVAPAGVVA